MDLGCGLYFHARLKRQFCLFWDQNAYYIKKKKKIMHTPYCHVRKKKKSPNKQTKTLPHLPRSSLHIISSHPNTRQSFSYPEGLPIRTLSSVQWFHSSVLQRRCPGQECYRCKQRGEMRVIILHTFIFIVLLSCSRTPENSRRRF